MVVAAVTVGIKGEAPVMALLSMAPRRMVTTLSKGIRIPKALLPDNRIRNKEMIKIRMERMHI
jgi:hypothetical protein